MAACSSRSVWPSKAALSSQRASGISRPSAFLPRTASYQGTRNACEALEPSRRFTDAPPTHLRKKPARNAARCRVLARPSASLATEDAAASRNAAPQETPPRGSLLFSHVVFDMDGTLTVSNIDFQAMRERTGIPEGDLFTVMDSWDDPARVESAHNTILQFEADACSALVLQPGLVELLAALRDRGARVSLVTRNTTVSVSAFFRALEELCRSQGAALEEQGRSQGEAAGEEWRSLFSVILTREFRFVKPDKRLLLHVAGEWGVAPSEMLMVGDSREDVECGRAAGTATCLISGGGNEVGARAVPGAQPDFHVSSLLELRDILLLKDNVSEQGQVLQLSSGELEKEQGAQRVTPPADDPSSQAEILTAGGLKFVDSLLASGVVRAAFCSYPRLAGAFGGASASTREGDRILHLQCGDGSLTKLLASQGLTVEGVDEDSDAVAAAASRGLVVHHVGPTEPLLAGSRKGQPVDVALSFSLSEPAPAEAAEPKSSKGDGSSFLVKSPFWASAGYADRVWQALVLGGHFAAGHLVVDPPQGMTLADATVALELAAQPFTERGFVVSRQAAERWPEGILASLVLTKPGLSSFKKVT